MGGKTALGDIGLKASGKNDFNLQEGSRKTSPEPLTLRCRTAKHTKTRLTTFQNHLSGQSNTPQHMRRLDSCKSKRNAHLLLSDTREQHADLEFGCSGCCLPTEFDVGCGCTCIMMSSSNLVWKRRRPPKISLQNQC